MLTGEMMSMFGMLYHPESLVHNSVYEAEHVSIFNCINVQREKSNLIWNQRLKDYFLFLSSVSSFTSSIYKKVHTHIYSTQQT